MNNYLVSIIMPAYNSQNTIENSILSVMKQSYENWELIVCDDFSSDKTLKVVNKYLAIDSRIKLIKLTKNQGAAVARNTAIANAGGRYLAFLDSDDTWEERKLELQIDFMISNNFAFTYTNYYVKRPNGKELEYRPRKSVTYNQCLYNNPIGCLTAIYDTKSLGKIYMPENADKREDFATWLKILKKIKRAYRLDKYLSTYYVSNNSLSSKKIQLLKYQFRLYRKVENIGYIKSVFLTMIYSFIKLIKYL